MQKIAKDVRPHKKKKLVSVPARPQEKPRSGFFKIFYLKKTQLLLIKGL